MLKKIYKRFVKRQPGAEDAHVLSISGGEKRGATRRKRPIDLTIENHPFTLKGPGGTGAV